MDEALAAAWTLASRAEADDGRRPVAEGPLEGVSDATPTVPDADSPQTEAGREAIMACVNACAAVGVGEALDLQARMAADFLAGPACRKGAVGAEYAKTMRV